MFKKTMRIISVVLAVMMMFSAFSMIATSAAKIPDGHVVSDKEGSDVAIDGVAFGLFGDSDGDAKISVKDATLIQKYAADLVKLDDVQLVLADVDQNGNVNVKDATAIQKWVAGIKVDMPINCMVYTSNPATTAATEVTTTASTAATTAPTEVTTGATEATTAPTEVTTGATEATTTPTEVTTGATETTTVPTTATEPDSDTITIYFTNTKDWENVYVHYWGGASSSSWPGDEMTYVRDSSTGKGIYKCDIPADTAGMVFDAGKDLPKDKQTVNVEEDIADGMGFYPNTQIKEDGNKDYDKWTVTSYVYDDHKDKTTATDATVTGTTATDTTAVDTTATEPDSDTITIYFTDTKDWGKVYVHYWGGASSSSWPGDEMTYVRDSSTGKGIYKCDIPADTTGMVFDAGKDLPKDKQTVDVKEDIADGMGFYPNTQIKEDGNADYDKWTVTSYVYEDHNDETTASDTTASDTTAADTTAADTTAVDTTAVDTTATEPDSDTITIYFTDTKDWEKVYVHYWGGASSSSWPGDEMTYVRDSSTGKGIYKCDIPADTTGMVFDAGKDLPKDKQTVDVKEDIADGMGFYPNTQIKEDGNADYDKWTVTSYVYEDHKDETTAADTTAADTTVADTTAADTTVADTTAADTTVADTTVADTTVADTTATEATETTTVPTTATEPDSDTITIYFTDTKDWGKVYVHYWGGASSSSWPGDEMTYVRDSSTGKGIYKCDIPADTTGMVFDAGKDLPKDKQTVDVKEDIADGMGFYPNTQIKEDGNANYDKWTVTSYVYKDNNDETTAADTTAADTTVADTTAAETTVADTTVAETTVAETTVADTTATETTEPAKKYLTLAETRALANGTENVTVRGTVTYINGGNIYIEDSTAALIINFKSTSGVTSRPAALKIGDYVEVTGEKSTLSGMSRFKSVDGKNSDIFSIISSGNTLPSQEASIADINADTAGEYKCERILIKNAKVEKVSETSVDIAQGTDKMTITAPNLTAKISVDDVVNVYIIATFVNAYKPIIVSADDVDVVPQEEDTVTITLCGQSTAWIADAGAVIKLVDVDTNTEYTMVKAADANNWTADVPATVTNVRFDRCNPSNLATVWNSWNAGSRGTKTVYMPESSKAGAWIDEIPTVSDEKVTIYFDNSETKWDYVAFYQWSDKSVLAGYTKMEKVGTSNIYKLEIPANITDGLFKGVDENSWEDAKQSSDIKIDTAKYGNDILFTPSSTGGKWNVTASSYK